MTNSWSVNIIYLLHIWVRRKGWSREGQQPQTKNGKCAKINRNSNCLFYTFWEAGAIPTLEIWMGPVKTGQTTLKKTYIIRSFFSQMFHYSDACTMVVGYWDHHVDNWPRFRPPFENQFTIQLPGTMLPGIWIANHLNYEQVNISVLRYFCYSDVGYSDPHSILNLALDQGWPNQRLGNITLDMYTLVVPLLALQPFKTWIIQPRLE